MAKAAVTSYVIGGGVALALAIAAYFLLRPKVAYAQPGVPAPGLPGPGVPPAAPVVEEFPVQSSIEVPEPILVEYGDIEFFVKKRTVAEAPSSATPATWQGFDSQGLRVGTTWYNLQWIAQWNPAAVAGPSGQGVLWVPADGPLGDFR